MGKFKVILKPQAENEFLQIEKSGNKAIIKRITTIIIELAEHPTFGTGNPEHLKHNLSGLWSRRLNKKDRLIYEIFEEPEDLVVVISALGHYL